MGNTPRQRSETGIYHVVTRGNGRQLIFLDDDDRLMFLKLLVDKMRTVEVRMLAWCLMDNHVHLLLDESASGCRGHCDTNGTPSSEALPSSRSQASPLGLSAGMQRLLTSYALYFNRKSGHVGHVFQQRFYSEPILTNRQLLATVRYIHRNPEKDGICPTSDYAWSSYNTYLQAGHRAATPGQDAAMAREDSSAVAAISHSEAPEPTAGPIVDTSTVMSLLGSADAFRELCTSASSHETGFEGPMRVTDADALEVARDVLRARGVTDPADLKTLSVPRRNNLLAALRRSGLTIKQIERLTGIGRGAIARARPV